MFMYMNIDVCSMMHIYSTYYPERGGIIDGEMMGTNIQLNNLENEVIQY